MHRELRWLWGLYMSHVTDLNVSLFQHIELLCFEKRFEFSTTFRFLKSPRRNFQNNPKKRLSQPEIAAELVSVTLRLGCGV